MNKYKVYCVSNPRKESVVFDNLKKAREFRELQHMLYNGSWELKRV